MNGSAAKPYFLLLATASKAVGRFQVADAGANGTCVVQALEIAPDAAPECGIKFYQPFVRRKMMTMDVKEFTKQVLDFQKGAFTSWCGAMSILQDQTASAMDAMLNQTGWIPDEGRQAISNWASTLKNERDRYNAYMEESICGLEKFFGRDTKTAPAKPSKPAAEAKSDPMVLKAKTAAAEEKKHPAAQEVKPSVIDLSPAKER